MINYSLFGLSFISPKVWTPEKISLFWLDNVNSSTITIGTGVSQWNDKSGNNNHVSQPTASQQPTILTNELNGYSAVRFTKANAQLLRSLTSISNNYKIIAVARPENLTTSQGALLKNGPDATTNSGTGVGWGGTTFDNGGANMIGLKEIIAWSASNIQISASYQIYTYSFPSSNVFRASVNNSNLTAFGNSLAPQNAVGYLGIGGYGAGSRSIDGRILELIALPITGDEVKAQGYLAHKYNLTSLLNADHPYKIQVPRP